jgi:hypothetical protein
MMFVCLFVRSMCFFSLRLLRAAVVKYREAIALSEAVRSPKVKTLVLFSKILK